MSDSIEKIPVEPERVRALNDLEPEKGAYVLYWMQASQRARFNPALETAVALADARKEPLVVGFGLMDDYPQANERHYAFLIEGLAETRRSLLDRGIGFVVKHGSPERVAVSLAQEASVVVCDRGYLRFQKAWREHVAAEAGRRTIEVEGDAVVPVGVASDKAESAARTLRPKISRALDRFLVRLPERSPKRDGTKAAPKSDFDLDDSYAVLKGLKIDRSVTPVTAFFRGGTGEGLKRLDRFVRDMLSKYSGERNEPSLAIGTALSPYLQFGQISPVEMALAVRESEDGPAADKDMFIEELVVRRELAINFVAHTPNYDQFSAIPNWARLTLEAHAKDERDPVYDRAALEAAKTHDPYWNAAQQEMLKTGFMHNYMRMYWGKQILFWSASPQEGYETTLYLNNKYLLDGRNASSYSNVGWLYGLHDRPWGERPVFGMVRSMTQGGLQRKFNMKAYVAKIENL